MYPILDRVRSAALRVARLDFLLPLRARDATRRIVPPRIRRATREVLEGRVLLSAWHNSLNAFDVNADSLVDQSDYDALSAFLAANNGGPVQVPEQPDPNPPSPPYFDVDDDSDADQQDLDAVAAAPWDLDDELLSALVDSNNDGSIAADDDAVEEQLPGNVVGVGDGSLVELHIQWQQPAPWRPFQVWLNVPGSLQVWRDIQRTEEVRFDGPQDNWRTAGEIPSTLYVSASERGEHYLTLHWMVGS